MIVMMAGLPGSGKSTLARALSEQLSGVVLDKDVIRAALFPPALIEYSLAQDDLCMEIMLETAAYLLSRNPSLPLFLDGRTFSRRYQRERVRETCRRLSVDCRIIECVCSEQTALDRVVRAAVRQSHLAANRTPELYREIRAAWEPIEGPRFVVDTDQPLPHCMEQALAGLIP